MNYVVTERTTCRVCGSHKLVCFLELPDMPLTDEPLTQEELGNEFLWPIRVFFCEACCVTQTSHEVGVEDYYRDYKYSVALSPFAQRFMRRLAERVWRAYGFQPGDSVIEVGSSDGTQLACFQALGASVFGFEPSAHLASEARSRGVPVAQRLFTPDAVADIPGYLLPAQVLLSTYTFDHLPDPMDFLVAVLGVLDSRSGVLILEVHDLEKIIERREFCLFEHEHTTYYTASTLQAVLSRAGFELISISLLQEVERRADSLLVAATPKGSALSRHAIPTLLLGALARANTYLEFGNAIQRSIFRLGKTVRGKRLQGLRLAGYGAGGRGVLTLAAALRPGDLLYVCDRNPNLQGRYIPKCHVPIVAANHVLTEPVDEIIVFSIGYMEEIVKDLSEHTARGGICTSMLELL